MKKELYDKAKAIMEEYEALEKQCLRMGRLLADVDREKPESITAFVTALTEHEPDRQVLWDIIDAACKKQTERMEELKAKFEAI